MPCEPLSAFLFQSTLPVWGATAANQYLDDMYIISIHAPRVGSDVLCGQLGAERQYFNPRSPCGERRKGRAAVCFHGHFNPRSPCGERPFDTDVYKGVTFISIHAPRVGSDSKDAQIFLLHLRQKGYFL